MKRADIQSNRLQFSLKFSADLSFQRHFESKVTDSSALLPFRDIDQPIDITTEAYKGHESS